MDDALLMRVLDGVTDLQKKFKALVGTESFCGRSNR